MCVQRTLGNHPLYRFAHSNARNPECCCQLAFRRQGVIRLQGSIGNGSAQRCLYLTIQWLRIVRIQLFIDALQALNWYGFFYSAHDQYYNQYITNNANTNLLLIRFNILNIIKTNIYG